MKEFGIEFDMGDILNKPKPLFRLKGRINPQKILINQLFSNILRLHLVTWELSSGREPRTDVHYSMMLTLKKSKEISLNYSFLS